MKTSQIALSLMILLIMMLPCVAIAAPVAKSADDSFLMEDFQEPVPDFGREDTQITTPAATTTPTGGEDEHSSTAYSVKKRTYLLLGYGGQSFAPDFWLNKELRAANVTYSASSFGKGVYTPITSGTTYGIEVRKGWTDNIMLGLAVLQTIGQSPFKKIRAPSSEAEAEARFDVTTTFLNMYLYSKMSERWEYYIGGGLGVSSGIIEWREKSSGIIVTDYDNSFADKAFGGQVFLGFDWRMLDNFLVELNLFYRGMELQTISLTGGGATLGLITSF